MIVALARPVATILLPTQQSTVRTTVDCSGSMRATDLQPTRLEAAKAAARTFVDNQPKNVHIGVVSFSNSAAVVQAPTTDRDAVTAAINWLSTQRATAVGSGILTSLEAIFKDPNAKPTPTSRDSMPLGAPTPTPAPMPRGTYAPATIVLLSDGVSNVGPRPLDAVRQAAARGVRVYTVGMGSPEGVVVNFDGRTVRVRLDEDTLRRVAEESDGGYFRAENESDLREIYQKLSSEVVLKAQQTELTAGFTGAAAVLMLVAGALSLLWFSRLP